MRYRPKMSFLSIEGSPVGRKNHRRLPLFCLDDGVRLTPTATLLEHLLLTQGFMSPSKAVSLIAGDRKIVILRGQFWATHSSVAVGLPSAPIKNPLGSEGTRKCQTSNCR